MVLLLCVQIHCHKGCTHTMIHVHMPTRDSHTCTCTCSRCTHPTMHTPTQCTTGLQIILCTLREDTEEPTTHEHSNRYQQKASQESNCTTVLQVRYVLLYIPSLSRFAMDAWFQPPPAEVFQNHHGYGGRRVTTRVIRSCVRMCKPY